MKRLIAAIAVVCSLGTVAAARPSRNSWYTAPPGNVFVISQQRGLFNLVRVPRDLPRRVCGGLEPVKVQTFHTAGDALAAVFTAVLWTPAHLKVTCPPQSTRL